MTTLRPVALAVGLFLAAPVHADVLVVGSGQPFATIQGAIDASQDGDIVLVKTGSYAGFAIVGRSLTVVADVGHQVTVQGGVSITDLPPGKSVVLDRLTVFGPLGVPAVDVQNAFGAVRLQDCVAWGANGTAFVDGSCHEVGTKDGQHALRAMTATNLAVVGGTLQGGIGATLWDAQCHVFGGAVWVGGAAGDGLHAWNTAVTLYDVDAYAGTSGSGSYAEPGGHGVSARLSTQVLLVHCEALGGSGGSSLDGIFPAPGGDGGHGLFVEGGSHARLLQTSAAGGLKGSGAASPGGAPAAPIGGGGLVDLWPGAWRGLGLINVLREGQVAPLQVSGLPGEVATLYASLSGGFGQLLPGLEGSLQLDPNQVIGPIVLGVLTETTFTRDIILPELPPTLQGIDLYLQAVMVGPGDSRLTSWAHLTGLDASF